jgi:hypothetical protein
MALGPVIRAGMNAATFRVIFLFGLLLLGADLIARSVI